MKLLNGVQIGVLVTLVFATVFGLMTIAQAIGEPIMEKYICSGRDLTREIGTYDVSILFIPLLFYVAFTVVVIYWLGEDKWKDRVKSILRVAK